MIALWGFSSYSFAMEKAPFIQITNMISFSSVNSIDIFDPWWPSDKVIVTMESFVLYVTNDKKFFIVFLPNDRDSKKPISVLTVCDMASKKWYEFVSKNSLDIDSHSSFIKTIREEIKEGKHNPLTSEEYLNSLNNKAITIRTHINRLHVHSQQKEIIDLLNSIGLKL